MKIFVTGAAGFIGRALCAEARSRGHEVLGMVRGAADEGTVRGSMESPPWREVEAFAPECVVHLAWVAKQGYLQSDENETLLRSSQEFLTRCVDMGVAQVSVAGTCLEYAAATEPLDDMTSPLAPAFPYVRAKMELWKWLQPVAEARGATASWLRIFYPYGPGEYERRLPTLIMRQLAEGKKVELRTPESVKDYIFITDLANAVCEVVERRLSGAINLGSGSGIRIRDLALKIAASMGVDAGLVGEAAILDKDPWPYHVASMKRLNAEGWQPRVSVERGVEQLLESPNLIAA